MKKVILMGRSGCGKTTLTQKLNGHRLEYQKTQAIEYVGEIVDTPGEYIENRAYYRALIVSSYDAECIAFVQDATDEESIFPPSFAAIFNKFVIGIVTKIDHPQANIERAVQYLQNTGCDAIISVSAFCNIGIDNLQQLLGDNGG